MSKEVFLAPTMILRRVVGEEVSSAELLQGWAVQIGRAMRALIDSRIGTTNEK